MRQAAAVDASGGVREAGRDDQGTGRAVPAGRPVRDRLPAAVVLAAILIGALQRWWVAAHPIGTLTSDGAVIGLMALRLLHHGQLSAFMWGQSYGGSLEAVLTALVFAVAGAGTSQLIATTALSSALCALALWRTGRRIVSEPAAQIAALAFWVWPATFLWRSLKPGGTYMVGLAIALCAVGALARIRQGDDGWRRCALAGLLCGLAVWSSPMSLELLIPAALWCIPVVRRIGWRLLVIAAGAVIGGLPILVSGVLGDWRDLHMPGYRADLLTGFPARLRQFFPVEGPIAMGVRAEGSLAWVGGSAGEILAVAGAAALVVTALAVIAGRAPRCTLPILTIALLPFLYSFIPLADHIGQGRYALFAIPMEALLVGVGLERAGTALRWRIAGGQGAAGNAGRTGGTQAWLVWTAGLALAAVLGTIGLRDEPAKQLVSFPAPDVAMPVNDSALLRLLAVHRVTDAYATYWVAYRVMFESRSRTRVTAYDYDRYPPIAKAVGESRDPAYLFISASKTVARFETWCHEHRVGYRAWHRGGFTVVQPARSVRPSEIPRTVLR
jgi:hypothetical protein